MAVAKTDTDAAAPETPAVPEAAVAEAPLIVREFEVLRDFGSHVATQLLRFSKGEVISSHPGELLYAAGAPLKPLA